MGLVEVLPAVLLLQVWLDAVPVQPWSLHMLCHLHSLHMRWKSGIFCTPCPFLSHTVLLSELQLAGVMESVEHGISSAS